MKTVNHAFFLALVAQFASADSVVNVTESSWVLPEFITYVSSFGSLQNRLLIPDAQTGFLKAVPVSGGASTNFATFGTISSYLNNEGTGTVTGGVILTSGPLTGSYLGVG